LRSDAFNSVSSGIPLALVPQENSIFGTVIDTADLLRLPISTGRDIFVVGEITLGIQHCLIVRKGVQLEEIETVLSHEQVRCCFSVLLDRSPNFNQALGQCSKFISENIPGASTMKMPSTSAAAQALLKPPTENINPFKSAAICSKITVTVFDGLETLREGVQDAKGSGPKILVASRFFTPLLQPTSRVFTSFRPACHLK
jgi:prephenate dehydratase